MDGAWRRPPESLSDYGHTEPRRGTECWGKSTLVTLGLFSKVTRRKGGTNISRYLKNGYVLNKTNRPQTWPDSCSTSQYCIPDPHAVETFTYASRP